MHVTFLHLQYLFSHTTKVVLPRLPQSHLTLRQFHNSRYIMSANPNIEMASIHAPAPGEKYEPRQTHDTEDYTPDPSKSIPLSKARQELVDDTIGLYSCKPTIEKMKRYMPDCVYDD